MDKIADTVSPTGCAELYSSILTKELCVIYEKEIRYLNNNLSFGTKHHLSWENDRSKVSSTRQECIVNNYNTCYALVICFTYTYASNTIQSKF